MLTLGPVPPHSSPPLVWPGRLGLFRSSIILASLFQSSSSLLSISSPYRFPLVYVEIPAVCRAVPSLGGQLPSGFRVVVVAVVPRAAAVVLHRTRRTCSVGSVLYSAISSPSPCRVSPPPVGAPELRLGGLVAVLCRDPDVWTTFAEKMQLWILLVFFLSHGLFVYKQKLSQRREKEELSTLQKCNFNFTFK